jgi:NADH:ubiquinone oxidoreductase subunit H
MSSFFFILSTICLMVFHFILVAYFTHAERKILGAVQRRRGPNVILQSVSTIKAKSLDTSKIFGYVF